MTATVKPLVLSAFAAGCLALSSGAQAPAPATAQPPVPPLPPTQPLGLPGGGMGGVARFYSPDGGGAFSRPFGDDPRTRELAKRLVEAKDDGDREKLRASLKETLAKAFDDRLKNQEKQVEELEKQLKRLRETVAKRKDAKADIVADRLVALEKEAKGLGW